MTRIFQVEFLHFTSICFYSPHFNTRICTFYSSRLQNRLALSVLTHLRGIRIIFISTPTAQDWFQPISERTDKEDTTRWKHAERETWTWRRGVLVSRICRDIKARCLDFLIFWICCCARNIYQSKISVFGIMGTRLGNRTESVFSYFFSWSFITQVSVLLLE